MISEQEFRLAWAYYKVRMNCSALQDKFCGKRERERERERDSPVVLERLDLLALWLPASEYLGAPVEGEGDGDTERAVTGSGMHSLIRSLRQ